MSEYVPCYKCTNDNCPRGISDKSNQTYTFCDSYIAPQSTNEPLTLEQLREMDGEPVWIVDIKHPEYSGWMQHAYDEDEYNLVAFWIFGNEVESTYSVDDYGNTWLAYCRKPEAINGE